MKLCSKCNIEKDEIDFPKDKRSNDGLYSYCKKCKHLLDKEYRDKNKKAIRERRKELYSEEKKIANRIRNRRYREKNKDKIKQRKSEWDINNIEYIREYRRNKRHIVNMRNRMKYIPKQRKPGRTPKERVNDGILNLKDWYIVACLARSLNAKAECIRKVPQLIEAKREVLKIERENKFIVDTERQCEVCNLTLSIERFRGGRAICKKCENKKYNRNKYLKRKNRI